DLGADERDRLVDGRPALVGGRDGLAAADRDRANRARLAAARRATEAEVAGLERRRGTATGFGDLQEVEARLAAVRGRLTRILAIDTALAGDRALLAVDPESGRAAIAAGDVDRAAHVGVFVPGFTARAEDLPGRMRELEALTRPDTAVVAWYDYPAPQWSEVTDPARSVLTPRVAEDASARLRSFLTGLTAGHVTAIGHSYGTVTVARGVLGAPTVDDVVLLGSPGVTPLPRQPTWVAEARGDPVADAGWFGPDPNGVPGLRVLATDGSWGHRGYLEPGSTSAAGIAAVVQGRPQDAALDPSVGVGDRLRRLLGP
ncbi:alpha/beta hydrolase, partial [Actinomycetospora atypica]